MGARENAANEGQIRATRATQKLDDDQLTADLSVVLSSRAGRNVLWSLLEGSGLYLSSFHEDAAWMAFREGNRNAGLQLLASIQRVDQAAYITMMQEHMKSPETKGNEDA